VWKLDFMNRPPVGQKTPPNDLFNGVYLFTLVYRKIKSISFKDFLNTGTLLISPIYLHYESYLLMTTCQFSLSFKPVFVY